MAKRSGFSLTFRLSFGFTLLITLLIGTLGFSIYIRDRNAFTQEAIKRGWAIARTASTLAVDTVNAQNHISLDKIVQDLRKDGFVTSAAVMDKKGNLMAYDGAKIPVADVIKIKNEEMSPILDENGNVTAVSFTSPILDKHGNICGYFYITVDFKFIQAYLDSMMYNIIINFVLVAIAGLLLSRIIIMRAVGEPVKELLQVTEKVAVGDFSSKLSIVTRDEIGRLARAFNAMSDQLGMLFGSIKNIVKDMNYTSTLITKRSEFLEGDEAKEIDSQRRSEMMKEINSGAKRLARMSDQLNSLALQFKTES